MEEGDLTPWGLRLGRLMTEEGAQAGKGLSDSCQTHGSRGAFHIKKEAGDEAHWFTHILQFIRGRLPVKLTEIKIQLLSLGEAP